MKQTKLLLIIDIVLYLLQIVLMITLYKYTQNNSLYSYFVFSLLYNVILSFSLLDVKRYNIKIIILNIFFTITVYCFGNRNLFQNREFWHTVSSISFNTTIFFCIAGNWMVAFIFRRLVGEK